MGAGYKQDQMSTIKGWYWFIILWEKLAGKLKENQNGELISIKEFYNKYFENTETEAVQAEIGDALNANSTRLEQWKRLGHSPLYLYQQVDFDVGDERPSSVLNACLFKLVEPLIYGTDASVNDRRLVQFGSLVAQHPHLVNDSVIQLLHRGRQHRNIGHLCVTALDHITIHTGKFWNPQTAQVDSLHKPIEFGIGATTWENTSKLHTQLGSFHKWYCDELRKKAQVSNDIFTKIMHYVNITRILSVYLEKRDRNIIDLSIIVPFGKWTRSFYQQAADLISGTSTSRKIYETEVPLTHAALIGYDHKVVDQSLILWVYQNLKADWATFKTTDYNVFQSQNLGDAQQVSEWVQQNTKFDTVRCQEAYTELTGDKGNALNFVPK